MGEAEAPVDAGDFGDHVGADALVDDLVELVLVVAAQLLEQLDAELAADHGGGREHVAGVARTAWRAGGRSPRGCPPAARPATARRCRPRSPIPRWRTISSRKNGLPLVLLPQPAVDVLGQPRCRTRRSARTASASSSPRSSIALEVVLAPELHEDVRRAPRAARCRGSSRRSAPATSSAARTSWRSISSVGVSAQCRSSSTSTTGWARAMSVSTSDGGVEQPVAVGRLGRARLALGEQLGDDAAELGTPRREPVGRGARDVAAQRLHERLVGDERLGVAAAVQGERAVGLARRP